MLLKLDLTKAYDRMGWAFIADTLHQNQIPPIISNIIMQIIRGGNTKLLWNGKKLEGRVLNPCKTSNKGTPLVLTSSSYAWTA